MLERLSEILRAALTDERPEEIRLAQELELLDRYVNDSDAAPGQQLSVERNVSPDALGALVPRGLLAPIVERVARREPRHENGEPKVTVAATRHEDVLRLSVIADRGAESSDEDWRERELGLADVRERLAGLYGSSQAIEWSPSGESGATTVITIPFRKALAGEEHATP